MTALDDFMKATRLQAVQGGVVAARADQLAMHPVLDQPSPFNRDDPVGVADGREPVGDNEDRPAAGDMLHIILYNPLAVVIESARRLIEN